MIYNLFIIHFFSQGNWKTQSNGRPRAGLVPKEIASIHGVSNINLPIRPLKQFCKLKEIKKMWVWILNFFFNTIDLNKGFLSKDMF